MSKRLILLVGFVLLLGACKQGGTTNTGSSPKSESPAGSQSETQTSGGGGSEKLEQGACALLTGQEVSTAFGGTFADGKEASGGENNTTCGYDSEGGAYATIYTAGSASAATFNAYSGQEGYESVSGVGEKATWNQDNATLVVLALGGTRLLTSQGHAGSDEPIGSKDAHVKLIQIAVTRMHR